MDAVSTASTLAAATAASTRLALGGAMLTMNADAAAGIAALLAEGAANIRAVTAEGVGGRLDRLA